MAYLNYAQKIYEKIVVEQMSWISVTCCLSPFEPVLILSWQAGSLLVIEREGDCFIYHYCSILITSSHADYSGSKIKCANQLKLVC